jgi:hypothetical protein
MRVLSITLSLVKLLLTANTRRPGLTGYVAVGGDGVEDYDAMEHGLKNHGYPAPESNGLALGGGGYGQIGRLIIGGQGEGGGSVSEDAHLISRVGMGSGMSLFGWLFIDSAWLRVYPLIGVGGRGAGLSVRPKNNTSRGVGLGAAGANVVIGVGVEVRLPLSRSFKPMIGAQVGWLWSPVGAWQGDLSVEPEALGERKASAPYVRLLIGSNSR